MGAGFRVVAVGVLLLTACSHRSTIAFAPQVNNLGAQVSKRPLRVAVVFPDSLRDFALDTHNGSGGDSIAIGASLEQGLLSAFRATIDSVVELPDGAPAPDVDLLVRCRVTHYYMRDQQRHSILHGSQYDPSAVQLWVTLDVLDPTSKELLRNVPLHGESNTQSFLGGLLGEGYERNVKGAIQAVVDDASTRLIGGAIEH